MGVIEMIVGGVLSAVQTGFQIDTQAKQLDQMKRQHAVEAGQQKKALQSQEIQKRKQDQQKRARDVQQASRENQDPNAAKTAPAGGGIGTDQLGQLGGNMMAGKTLLGS